MQIPKGTATSSPDADPQLMKKRRGKRGARLYLMLATALFFFTVTVAGGYVLSQMNKTLEVVTQNPYHIPEVTPVSSEYEEKEPLSFVIVGLDTRENIGMLNTDVLVVAVANPETKKLTMVSLPRDTRVEMPGYPGYHKVNEVFALGENIRYDAERKGQPVTENGMTLLKKTLEQMLGIPIEHYVQLDFEGFTSVIDSLGGVSVEVDRELVYELPQQGVYRTLKPGLQLLNGEQALGFVRHRVDRRGAAYNSSDFDRNRRQQQVMRAVAEKAVSLDGLSKMTELLETMGKHIRTDLSAEQIKGLALDFAGFSSQQMVSLDNGAVWRSPYTLWPQKNMQDVRAALRAEMGDKSLAATRKLSDAAVAEFAQLQAPAKPKSSPPAAKPAAAKPAPAQQPVPAQQPAPTQQAAPDSSTPVPRQEAEGQQDSTQPADHEQADHAEVPAEATVPSEEAQDQPDEGVPPVSGQESSEPYPSSQPPPDIVAPPATPAEGVGTGETGSQ